MERTAFGQEAPGISAHPMFRHSMDSLLTSNRYSEYARSEESMLLVGDAQSQGSIFGSKMEEGWDKRFASFSPVVQVYGMGTFADGLLLGGLRVDSGQDSSPVYWDGFQYANLMTEGLGGQVTQIHAVGEELYIGGAFNFVEGNIGGVAHWDGTQWRGLDFSNSSLFTGIHALHVSGEDVYIGGLFTNVGGNDEADFIARWDGSRWNGIGGGLNGQVNAMVFVGDDIYVGGEFTNAGGVQGANRIARWDGTQWHSVGNGLNRAVNALAYKDGILYAGGEFDDAGGVENASHVAAWDGTQWASLGTEIIHEVTALTFYENELYAGGDFFNPENQDLSQPAGGVARWDGTAWRNVGNGLTGLVLNFTEFNGELYAGGLIVGEGGGGNAGFVGIARWNGEEWLPLSNGIHNGAVASITEVNDELYIGGIFANPEGDQVSIPLSGYVARWDGNRWRNVDRGVEAAVSSIVSHNEELHLGGAFTNAGSLSNADGVVRWDGSEWYNLGMGLDATCDTGIQKLFSFNGDLYAGGCFSDPGGNADIASVARWDGSQWHPLGTGLNDYVSDIISDGTNLYVAGRFTDAGGDLDADHIAMWDGAAWSSVGVSAFNNDVYALAYLNGTLYAGGGFTNAGGDPDADYMAKWDGVAWTAVGEAFDWDVFELLPVGNNLIAGGRFTKVGENDVAALARWDGTAWTSVGGGLYQGVGDAGTVLALYMSNEKLYVGGQFNIAGDFTQTANFGILPIDSFDNVSSDIEQEDAYVSDGIRIGSYPNPFIHTVTFSIDLDAPENVQLVVYDALGREIEKVIDDLHVIGTHSISWDAVDLAPGVYFYTFKVGQAIQNGSIVKGWR